MTEPTQTGAPPLVSVVVPAYNAERWIERTLASALGQTYRQIEVLVVDDGSTDRTPALIESAAAADPRLRLVRQANGGVAAARNRGIGEAAGEYIALLDADDLWYPEKIAKQLARFQSDAEPGRLGLVYCWSQSVDEADQVLRAGLPREVIEGEVFDRLFNENFVGNGSSPMMRASALRAVGGYDESFGMGCEDWELYLRMADRFRIGVVPEFLLGYRIVGGSMSKDFGKMLASYEHLLERVRAYRPSLTAAVVRDSRSSLHFGLLVLTKPGSKPFFQIAARAFSSDPWLAFRPHTWRRVGRILHSLTRRWKSRIG